MLSTSPLSAPPSRRSRYWVHAVPVVVAVAVLVIPVVAGVMAFNVAASDPGSAPAAPMGFLVVWMAWLFPLGAVGSFVILLAYLVVLPSRSRGRWVTQIVLTSLMGIFAFFCVILAVHLLLSL
jgi:hypothetical protein